MSEFSLNLSTKIFFGKGKVKELGEAIKPFGKKVMVVTGGGSIKKYGIFNEVANELNRSGFEWFEYSGVVPNPRLSHCISGAKIAIEEKVDFLLAVGGGSVLDATKAISFLGFTKGNVWEDYFVNNKDIEKALPIGVVLTLSATGSEMNGNAVITNEEKKQKIAARSENLKPKFAILDPTYTFSVPKEHTANGIADIFSHLFEQYFSPEEIDWWVPDRMAEGVMKTLIKWGPVACEEGNNYFARANIMWASTVGLNGLLGVGKSGDWATHKIEHELSAYYDIPHGAGLAVLHPTWMEYVLDENTKERFANYGRNVWGIEGKSEMEVAKKAIEKTRFFFKSLGLPSKLRELKIDDKYFSNMAEEVISIYKGEVGRLKKLTKEDIENILKLAE
ncbi:MAG: iron-containing alcohol dehydrogenase [candidate division WOR-3 bacterium]